MKPFKLSTDQNCYDAKLLAIRAVGGLLLLAELIILALQGGLNIEISPFDFSKLNCCLPFDDCFAFLMSGDANRMLNFDLPVILR